MTNSKNTLFCSLENGLSGVTTSSKSFHLNLSRVFWPAWHWRCFTNIPGVHLPAWSESSNQGTSSVKAEPRTDLSYLLVKTHTELGLLRSPQTTTLVAGPGRRQSRMRKSAAHSELYQKHGGHHGLLYWAGSTSPGPPYYLENESIWMQETKLLGEGSREAKAKCSQSLKPEAGFRRQQLTGESQR